MSIADIHCRSRGLGALFISSTSVHIMLAAVYACGVQAALGQEALRSSLAGEEAAALRRNQLENQPGNFQLGLARFMVGASMGLELNNNINYSDIQREKDVILRPGGSFSAWMPITDENEVSSTLDISYAKYINHPENDRLLIAPGTQLGFDAYVKDFHFNVHDYIALLAQPVAQGAISGSGDYSEFSNTAGLSVDWDLNALIATFSYDHVNAISITSAFSYLDRSSDNLVLRAAFQPSDTWNLGPEASGGITDYDQQVLNNNKNYSVGAFATWTPGTLFKADIRGGYTSYIFEPLPGQGSLPDGNGYYLDANVSQRVNEILGFSIDAGRQLRIGVNSDLLDLWYAYPRLDWNIFEKVPINTHLTYEDGTDIGTTVLVTNEHYTLLGGGIGATYQLMEKLLLGLSYDYDVKNSNIPVRNYHQQRVLLEIQYTF